MSQILYGVGLTPTVPWEPNRQLGPHEVGPNDMGGNPPWVPGKPADPATPFDMESWRNRIAEVSDVRETAIAVLSWYAACVSLPNEEERKRLNKPCSKMSVAIASLEWVRENMPKIPCITDRDMTLMWLDGRVETVL